MVAAGRDAQRARVYAAEDAWALRLDAARRGGRKAVVAGSTVDLPAEMRFGSLADAQAYVDHHVAALGLPPVRLRERRGQRAAHYEPRDPGPAQVALPFPRYGEPWALRESVLLHELAHHLQACTGAAGSGGLGTAPHGPSYPPCMLVLVAQALGEEAAFALRVDYGEHGVQVG